MKTIEISDALVQAEVQIDRSIESIDLLTHAEMAMLCSWVKKGLVEIQFRRLRYEQNIYADLEQSE